MIAARMYLEPGESCTFHQLGPVIESTTRKFKSFRRTTETFANGTKLIWRIYPDGLREIEVK